MAIEPQIRTTRGELPGEAASEIRERAAKLEQFFRRTLSCRVSVEGPGGHHRAGRWKVGLRVKVPLAELVISRQAADDVMTAVRQAFDAADRRLEDYVRRLRGDVKARRALPRARVVRIFRDDGYGFLAADGLEIYFHRNSVLSPGFDRLEVGSEVRFAEEEGEEGPQASTVIPVGSSH